MKINFKYFTFLFLVALFVFPNLINAQYLASDLLGQLDGSNNPVFTTSTANNGAGVGFPNDKGFYVPIDIIVDSVHHRLFVSDSFNRRVLVFNLDTNNNLIDRVADYVIGQPDFTATNAVTGQNSFNAGGCAACGLAYDSVNDRLFVSDENRVLVFDTTTIVNGENAINVLGQVDFTSSSSTLNQSTLSDLRSATLYDEENGWLFVSSRTQNRTLIFDVNSITDGENAIYVLGQPDFTTNTALTTQNGINRPNYGMAYDSVRNLLFVSSQSNRVTVYEIDPDTITNGMNASYVLGQTDFTSAVGGVTQSKINPLGLAYDEINNLLFVAGNTAGRVLMFDLENISNGMNATSILGQTDFISSTTAVSQSRFANASGLAFDNDNNRLYVGEYIQGNRIKIFNFVKLSTTNPSNATQDTAYSQSLSTTNSQGTVSYEVTEGALPAGLSLDTNTGEISGTPTLLGSYDFTVQATDDNGAIGYFLSQPQEYTLVVDEAPKSSSGSRPKSRVITYVPESITPYVCTITINILKLSSSGADVSCLQQKLNTLLTLTLDTDGIFGPLTKQAVVNFQIKNGLVGDGIVGPLTRGVLK